MEKVTRKRCELSECPVWSLSSWSECSVSCGIGVRHAALQCVMGGQTVERSKCGEEEPMMKEEECNKGVCAEWETSEWTECSSKCGKGESRRAVRCVALGTRETLNEVDCSGSKKPDSEENDIETDAVMKDVLEDKDLEDDKLYISRRKWISVGHSRLPRYRWKIGHWSTCSSECGAGQQSRIVTCYDRVRGQRETDKRHCSRVRHKPRDRQTCFSDKCEEGKWLEGEWSPCSVSCGQVFDMSFSNSLTFTRST